MRITVKLFGTYRELHNQQLLSLELPDGATAGDVWNRLVDRIPRLQAARPGVAVNLEYVGFDKPLHDGDELAFLPPVGGG